MADSRHITRRSALVGALSSIFIPPAALSLIQPAIAGQEVMSAYERADFHMAELAKAMHELKPIRADRWALSMSGDGHEFCSSREAVYHVHDPEIERRIGREFLIEKRAEFR